jgi:putative DNA primase/helicase
MLRSFFVFYGVSNSGKSVYLDLLEYMIREENVSHIPLQKLEEESIQQNYLENY